MPFRKFTSNYFVSLGWDLIEAPDELRTKYPKIVWQLVPHPSSNESEHRFESLGDIWRWWKREMRRYLIIQRCYEEIISHFENANALERREMIEFAQDNGITCWRATFNQIERSSSRFVYRQRLPRGWIRSMQTISDNSPEISHYGFFQVLKRILIESDAQREKMTLIEKIPCALDKAKDMCVKRL